MKGPGKSLLSMLSIKFLSLLIINSSNDRGCSDIKGLANKQNKLKILEEGSVNN